MERKRQNYLSALISIFAIVTYLNSCTSAPRHPSARPSAFLQSGVPSDRDLIDSRCYFPEYIRKQIDSDLDWKDYRDVAFSYTSAKGYCLEFSDSNIFASKKLKLSPIGERFLLNFAKAIASYSFMIGVEAYTRNSASSSVPETWNETYKRSSFIANYLFSRGKISGDRIEIVARGEFDQPINVERKGIRVPNSRIVLVLRTYDPLRKTTAEPGPVIQASPQPDSFNKYFMPPHIPGRDVRK